MSQVHYEAIFTDPIKYLAGIGDPYDHTDGGKLGDTLVQVDDP
jgi:hypothetical protein